MPEDSRPYEKCLRLGAHSLSDTELLAVVLRSGVPGKNALGLAEAVLCATRNTPYPGLRGLLHLSSHELMKIGGVGRVKSLQLLCIGELSKRIASSAPVFRRNFSNPAVIADYFMEKLCHEGQEKVIGLMLDSKNQFLGEPVLSKGTANAALITPREVFVEALRFHAVSIILIHNHPSGDPAPSRSDIELTQQVAAAGRILGVLLLDHIVIGDHRYISFREQELVRF